MSNVIPFPDRKPENVMVVGSGPITFGECSEVVHYFAETPGICNCGENYWEPPKEPVQRPRAVSD